MILTDTHTHLYEESLLTDFDAMYKRALHNRVKRFFIPNVDSSTTEKLIEICQNYEGVFGMMGLHPCSVNENYEEELRLLHQKFNDFKFVAVGEIGIDLYWDKSFYKQQVSAFKTQLQWSLEMNLPVAIHCREAFDEIYQIIALPEYKNVRGIFHCFTGTEEQANKVIDLGFYLGIGGVITFKNSGLAENLKNVSLEHIVLETDSPYLAPVPYRGKRNESSYLLQIAEKLADVKDVSLAEVAGVTTQNSIKIFGI
jgi:TatD DNase family protein